MATRQDFFAQGNTGWGPSIACAYPGGAPSPIDHIAMQIRLYGGAANALLTINPLAFTDADNGDGTRTLTLLPSVTAAQLIALPPAAATQMAAAAVLANLPAAPGPEIGQPLVFAHDVRIAYQDGTFEVILWGAFNLIPGVTTV